MKRIMLALLLASGTSAFAAGTTHVDGYVRKDGTYVAPHFRTTPDSSRSNNFSSQGNVNPYTGQTGTVNPYAVPAPLFGINPNSSPTRNPYER